MKAEVIRANTFRPWGLLPKIASKLGGQDFAFIGSVSTEERGVAAYSYLKNNNLVGSSRFYELVDASSRFSSRVEELRAAQARQLSEFGVRNSDIFNAPLLGLFGEIADDFGLFIESVTERSIVIDISGLPKKIFFFAIRELLGAGSKFDNVIICYTEPHSYHDGALAENPQAWHALPGFLAPRSEPDSRMLIVGLGFEPLGLPDLYSSGHFAAAESHLLLPVTADQQHVARNWDFVRMLEAESGTLSRTIRRVDARNLPDIFDFISATTRRGEIYSVLAPFGPKPVSLAMCLYACSTIRNEYPASVFYTQPSVDNPDYSSGIKYVNGAVVTHAYCVRLNGANLY